MKNINRIELLAQDRCLSSNTSSWLVLQSFHPPPAGFFLAVRLRHEKGARRPLVVMGIHQNTYLTRALRLRPGSVLLLVLALALCPVMLS